MSKMSKLKVISQKSTKGFYDFEIKSKNRANLMTFREICTFMCVNMSTALIESHYRCVSLGQVKKKNPAFRNLTVLSRFQQKKKKKSAVFLGTTITKIAANS